MAPVTKTKTVPAAAPAKTSGLSGLKMLIPSRTRGGGRGFAPVAGDFLKVFNPPSKTSLAYATFSNESAERMGLSYDEGQGVNRLEVAYDPEQRLVAIVPKADGHFKVVYNAKSKKDAKSGHKVAQKLLSEIPSAKYTFSHTEEDTYEGEAVVVSYYKFEHEIESKPRPRANTGTSGKLKGSKQGPETVDDEDLVSELVLDDEDETEESDETDEEESDEELEDDEELELDEDDDEEMEVAPIAKSGKNKR